MTLASWPAGRRSRPRARVRAAAAVISVVAAAGCSSGTTTDGAAQVADPGAARLPATAPYLLMTSETTGWAVWPSGKAWVLLATTDGWRTVSNATPIAVPTGGGLVVTHSGQQLELAVAPYERLTSSPILRKRDGTTQWQPAELPGAVVDDRDALSLASGRVTALTTPAGGTLVAAGAGGWSTLTTAADLASTGGLHLDTITWANADVGWLTGHGRAGTSVAFRTTDAGRQWAPVAVPDRSAVAALAPCGSGSSWLLPIVGSGSITLLRTSDGGSSWSGGAPLQLPAGPPAWGCQGSHVWMVGRSGSADHVFASPDGGRTWADRGAAPAGLSALQPETTTTGYAASRAGGTATLWSVAGDGARFSRQALPGWVATLGGEAATS